MMRAAMLTWFTACSFGCAPPDDGVAPPRVQLALAPGDDTCDGDDLVDEVDAIRLLSATTDSPTCISVASVDSVVELQGELARQQVSLPPLVAGDHTILLVGYDSAGCDPSDEIACAQTSFTLPLASDDDVVTLPLFCRNSDDPSDVVESCLESAPPF